MSTTTKVVLLSGLTALVLMNLAAHTVIGRQLLLAPGAKLLDALGAKKPTA